MNVDLTIDCYIAASKIGGVNCLLEPGMAVPISLPLRVMQGNTLPINLYFCAITSNLATPTDLATGTVIICTAKASTGIAAGDLLFLASDFAKVSGQGIITHYTATLNLDTQAIATALAAAGDTLNLAVDVECRNAANTERATYRFAAILCARVYAGESVPSALGLPPAILQAPGGSRWELAVNDDGAITSRRVL